MGGGVRGILLDSSVLLAGDGSATPGAQYLLRKLRYSNIPTGISYAVGLSDAKVRLLEEMGRLNLCRCFIINPSSMDQTLNEVALAWEDNGGSILHVVSNSINELFPKLCNHDWLDIIVNVDGGRASLNSSMLLIDKLEELPLTICNLNRKLKGKENVVVGYIMKPSREEDFAKRGAFPLLPTENGLIFLPLTFDLPIASQLQIVDVVFHKATDEITSVELNNSSECCNKIIYTRGMLEFQRFIDQQPNCCVIDSFSSIYPVVDRLNIQYILLGLDHLNTNDRCKIRGPHFLELDNFEDPNLEEKLSEAKLSQPSIVKPQVACGVADAHSMPGMTYTLIIYQYGPDFFYRTYRRDINRAIVFKVEDFMGLSIPLPAVVQEYVDHSSTIFKFYVLGDKIFYAVKKSTPNADILRSLSEKNGFRPLLFDSLKSLPVDEESKPSGEGDHQQRIDIALVTDAASWLRKTLNLTIFGFDVVIQEGTGDHVIVDVNYLPSFKEVANEIAIPAFWEAIKNRYDQWRKTNKHH